MKNNKSKIISLILIIVLIAALIGFLIYETAQNGWQLKTDDLGKFVIVLAGLVLSLIRLLAAPRGTSLKIYERSYKEHICSAFSRPEQKKEKTKLLKAIKTYNEDNYASAIKQLDALLEKTNYGDDICAVLMFKALAQTDAGLSDDAISTYEELLKYDKKRSAVWSNLGILYMKKGRRADALRCYTSALELDKENPQAWNNLAQAYLTIGDWQRVIEPAKRAIEINEKMHQSESALSIALFALGEKEESKKYFDRAVLHGSNGESIKNVLDMLERGQFPFGERNDIREEISEAVDILRRGSALPMTRIMLPCPEDKNKTRFGGKAVDIQPPIDRNGLPMKLLAAIWCSEIRGVSDFPEKGVLRFYVSDTPSLITDHTQPIPNVDCKVLYDEDESLFDAEMYDDESLSETFPIKHPIPLRLAPVMSTVLCNDYRFRDHLFNALEKVNVDKNSLTEDEINYIFENNYYGGHRIGGYPCFEDNDPRRDDASLQKYDSLLLQIVTHIYPDESGKEIEYVNFENEGSCQFFIPREKLRQKDFSDVLFVCGH